MKCYCEHKTEFQKLLHLLGKFISFGVTYTSAIIFSIVLVGLIGILIIEKESKKVQALEAKIELLELGIEFPVE